MGQNLNDISGLTDKTAEYLRDMKQTGMRKALKKMMNSQMAELGTCDERLLDDQFSR